MKIDIFSILDFNGNKCNDPQMLPLYLDHYREKFPNCIFNIYLNDYPDNYNGEELKILDANDCKVTSIKLGDNRMYFEQIRSTLSIEEMVESALIFPEYTINEKNFKSNIWKDSDADWIIVTDIDELLQIDKEELEKEGDIIKFVGYQMIRYNEDEPFVDLTHGHPDTQMNKTSMFRSTIDDINYSTGCHKCNPKKDGKIIEYDQKLNPHRLLHYKKIAMDNVEAEGIICIK